MPETTEDCGGSVERLGSAGLSCVVSRDCCSVGHSKESMMVLMRDAWRCQLETYREALQLALLNRAARGGGWETEGGGVGGASKRFSTREHGHSIGLKEPRLQKSSGRGLTEEDLARATNFIMPSSWMSEDNPGTLKKTDFCGNPDIQGKIPESRCGAQNPRR